MKMLGPCLGPHVEEIYRLHQEGVTTRQMADVARLFVDQASARASAAAMKRQVPMESYLRGSMTAQLADWERNAEREARRQENAADQIAEVSVRATKTASQQGRTPPTEQLIADVVDGSGTAATIVGHIVCYAPDANGLLTWMLENKHRGATLWFTYSFEFGRDIEAMVGWIRARAASQTAPILQTGSEENSL